MKLSVGIVSNGMVVEVAKHQRDVLRTSSVEKTAKALAQMGREGVRVVSVDDETGKVRADKPLVAKSNTVQERPGMNMNGSGAPRHRR